MQARRILALAALALLAPLAGANPTGATVVSGSATFSTSGSTLTIVNSPNAIITWQTFSIAPGETVQFVQSSASSAVLNRMVSVWTPTIAGTISSNGKVFLALSNGLFISGNAQLNSQGLHVYDGTEFTNAHFLAGQYGAAYGTIFTPSPNAPPGFAYVGTPTAWVYPAPPLPPSPPSGGGSVLAPEAGSATAERVIATRHSLEDFPATRRARANVAAPLMLRLQKREVAF